VDETVVTDITFPTNPDLRLWDVMLHSYDPTSHKAFLRLHQGGFPSRLDASNYVREQSQAMNMSQVSDLRLQVEPCNHKNRERLHGGGR